MKFLFIQTGGTIDKDYPRSSGGWAFEFGEPATKRLLAKLNPSFDFEIQTAFQKDSLEIVDSDRKVLADMIKQSPVSTKVIVTHGTDTLLETANYLQENCRGRLIILTGAMRPERFSNSDAPINLGMAIATAQHYGEGVFVCIHGLSKLASQMKRDAETGRFY